MDKRISHFHLSLGVKSLKESSDFFVGVLGASIHHQDPSGYVNIDFHGTQVTLKENVSVSPEIADFHFGVNMSLKDFNELAKIIDRLAPRSISMPPKVVDAGTSM